MLTRMCVLWQGDIGAGRRRRIRWGGADQSASKDINRSDRQEDMDHNVRNSRYARQNFAELIDLAGKGSSTAIERNGSIVAYIVSESAGKFIEELENVQDVNQLISVLSTQNISLSRPFVRPDFLAAISIALRERNPNARGVMELKRAIATRHPDQGVIHVKFEDDESVRDGWIILNTRGDGSKYVSGRVELFEQNRKFYIEFSNAQKIFKKPAESNVFLFDGFVVDGEISLENTKIIFEN